MLDKIERIRGHIKDIDTQLLKMLGMAKVPLMYVVKENVTILAPNEDPSNGYSMVAGRDGGWDATYSHGIP
jgi:hypothetical protein